MNTNPTEYHEDTPEALRLLLESLIHTGKRVRMFYGHTEHDEGPAGQDWHEENDVSGYLGRSTGTKPCVILLPTRRSHGGGGILDHCIVKLLVEGVEVYKHPLYRNGTYTTRPSTDISKWADMKYECEVLIDTTLHARFRTQAQAARWVDFMTGQRMTK